MRTRLGLPAIALAATVVLAFVAGGAVAIGKRLAARPADGAVPLPADPHESEVQLAKLEVGRGPQMVYLTGRTIKGGAGSDIVVPGKQQILQAVRYVGSALIVLQKGSSGSELARIDGDEGFAAERIPDVRSVVSSLEQDAAAYATVRTTAGRARAKGSTIFWQGRATEVRRKLQRPDDWGATVIAVMGDTVYFAAATGPGTAKSTLNSWDSARGRVTPLKGVVEPAVTDYQGKLVVTRDSPTQRRGCSALVNLESGRQLWKSCDYAVGGFTFGGTTVFGTSITDTVDGAARIAAAFDTRTAAEKRRWTGVRFLAGVAEDDEHLLFSVDNGAGTPGAIIRCWIQTGGCERTTAFTKTTLPDVRLLGAR